MAGGKITLDTVRGIARTLPGAEESTMYGSPAFKVGGKMFACVPVNKSAEADSLAVCVDMESRAALLAEAPETYYVTDHYAGHPIVLVRLPRISHAALGGLLRGAWKSVSARAKTGNKR